MITENDGTAALAVIEEKRPKLKSETKQIDNAIAKATSFEIAKQDDADKAARWLTQAKERKRYLDGWKDEVVKPIYRTYKASLNEFSSPGKKYDELIKLLATKLGTWNAELKEQARKREQAIREEQERQREEERLRLEAEAAKAKEQGDDELAAEKLSEAEHPHVTPVVVVPHREPKYEGLVTRGEWKARVVDKEKFIAAVLAGEIDSMYAKIEPNTRMINSLAKAKEGSAKLAGVEFYEDTTFASKG